MPRALTCPTCNAALPADARPGRSVTCDFCGGHVVIPGEAPAAHGAAPVPSATAGPPAAVQVRVARRPAGGRLLLALIVTVAVGVGIGLPILGAVGGADLDLPALDGVTGPTPELVLGGAGSGPGRFDDAREVGVDGEGLVYVGEFSSKRIQRFTGDGELSGQWTVEEGQPTVPLSGMAVGRDGTVYAQVGFEVYRYRGATGEPLGQLRSTGAGPFDWFDAVAPHPDGGLVVVERDGGRSHLVWLSREGTETRRLSPPDLQSPGGIQRLVVDGQGRVTGVGRRAATGGSETGLYTIDPDGGYRGFVAQEGVSLGLGLAVGGDSDLWVSAIGGLRHLDRDGRALDGLGIGGPVYGVAVDDDGRLWVATGSEVRAYRLQ